MADVGKVYPRTGDMQTVYLKNVITNQNIEVGDYTMYNDFANDPANFEQKCRLCFQINTGMYSLLSRD